MLCSIDISKNNENSVNKNHNMSALFINKINILGIYILLMILGFKLLSLHPLYLTHIVII